MEGVIEVNGLQFKLPPKPKKKDILFSNLKKREQKWKRTEVPETSYRIFPLLPFTHELVIKSCNKKFSSPDFLNIA